MDDSLSWETASPIIPLPAPRRRSSRLPHYDYAASGCYFVTVCLHDRAELFGDVREEHLVPSPAGEMVAEVWAGLPSRFSGVELDEYIVMPDHLHGILVLTRENSGTSGPTVGAIVGAFKSLTTLRYINGVAKHGWRRFESRLWQRGFHEHVVRNERSLAEIREYIRWNPIRWGDRAAG